MSWVGDIVGGFIQAEGAKGAARTQADAANRATELQRLMWEQTRGDNAPALGARNDALTQLRALLGLDGKGGSAIPTAAQVMAEPGYQFGLTQGNQNIERGAAARGGLYSGQVMKALNQFGNDYATTKFDQAFNRKQSALNPLLSMAGLGQTAANVNANAGSNYANQAGNNMIGAGNANAANQMAQGNIWGNMLNKWQAGGMGGGGNAWNMGGYNGGSNDMGMGGGAPMDWFMSYGSGGD